MKENDNSSPGAGCSGHTVPTIEWSRRIPLRYEADVAVIGGGSAGVAAAWSADRGCSPRDIDGIELRLQLEQYGANLDLTLEGDRQ